MHSGTRQTFARRAFTLVELMIAVALMAVIILTAAVIFDTTTKAITLNQANAEQHHSLAAFSELVRNDIRGIEPDGFLIFGQRKQTAYGNMLDRANELQTEVRNDWLMLMTTTQQEGAVDGRAVGQWARILYGHGKVADRVHSGHSDVTTDWALLRHQMLLVPGELHSGSSEGVESPYTGGTYIMSNRRFNRVMLTHTARQFHWYGANNYQWVGTMDWNVGPADPSGRRLAVFEPAYYHTLPNIRTDDPREFYALPHCGHFQIEFVLPEDLRNSPGGTVLWRDGPLWQDPRLSAAAPTGYENPYPDPNYNPSDPIAGNPDRPHPTANIPVGVVGASSGTGLNVDMNAGRILFGPGDRWPALLRVTIKVWDPLSRMDGPMTAIMVLPIH